MMLTIKQLDLLYGDARALNGVSLDVPAGAVRWTL